MDINFEVSAEIPGGKAVVSDIVGDSFTAWDGYIEGKNIKLIPGELIVQHWRTSEFNDSDKDSRLEIQPEALKGSTRVTIRHSMLPAHGMQYQQGWVDNYFDPMKSYFSSQAP